MSFRWTFPNTAASCFDFFNHILLSGHLWYDFPIQPHRDKYRTTQQALWEWPLSKPVHVYFSLILKPEGFGSPPLPIMLSNWRSQAKNRVKSPGQIIFQPLLRKETRSTDAVVPSSLAGWCPYPALPTAEPIAALGACRQRAGIAALSSFTGTLLRNTDICRRTYKKNRWAPYFSHSFLACYLDRFFTRLLCTGSRRELALWSMKLLHLLLCNIENHFPNSQCCSLNTDIVALTRVYFIIFKDWFCIGSYCYYSSELKWW